ncbi:GNAT family N-acetyltransferase [Corynebacterium frankenforstense]|uniref:GNAT family N-acetyltransferase n=1 Tax=Corynebacterium frankenforstense TaxID=1230998 RepID=UPI0026F2B8CE|nr:GNAT family N-acetyltransferase [Corynebacterium frankenforstense]
MRTVLVPPGAEDAVRTFCFTANLLAQEATGTPAAAVAVEDVHTQLVGGDPLAPRSVLLALVDQPGPATVGEFGLPVMADPDAEAAGFAHVILPAEDARRLAAVEIVPDVGLCPPAPTPIDDVPQLAVAVQELLAAAAGVARAAGRDTLQAFTRDPRFGALFEACGFRHALTEVQAVVDFGGEPDDGVVVVEDLAVPGDLVEGVCALFAVDDADSAHGALAVAPEPWDRARLERTRARLAAEGTHGVMTVLVEDGRPVALAEAYRTAGQRADVTEHGTTVVARGRRQSGLGTRVTRALLALGEGEFFLTYSPDDPAAAGLARRLGARELARLGSFELAL